MAAKRETDLAFLEHVDSLGGGETLMSKAKPLNTCVQIKPNSGSFILGEPRWYLLVTAGFCHVTVKAQQACCIYE